MKNDTDKRELFFGFIFAAAIVMGLVVDGCGYVYGVEFRRADPTLGDVHAASCRVRVSNARGTGIFNGYNAAEGVAYISTNDHVTTTAGSCKLDFWTNSKMQTVDGRVVFSIRDDRAARDFAIIAVDAYALKEIDPPFIPMKPVRLEDLAGLPFLSSGCPDGRFDQGFRGVIERVDGGMAIFSPPPVPGQSGSGICVAFEGKLFDVAKLTYLLGTKGADESKGGALPLVNIVTSLQSMSAGLGVASIQYERTPVSYILDEGEGAQPVEAAAPAVAPAGVYRAPQISSPQSQGAPLYSFTADNGIKVQSPGEPDKTIAVFVTDKSSYDMTPAPVASRTAPRGLFNDLFGGGEETPKDEGEPAPETRRGGGNDAGGGYLGSSIVDRIGERVETGVIGAFCEIVKRFRRTIFWALIICAALGALLARVVVKAFKWAGKKLEAFTTAYKAVIEDKNKNG